MVFAATIDRDNGHERDPKHFAVWSNFIFIPERKFEHKEQEVFLSVFCIYLIKM